VLTVPDAASEETFVLEELAALAQGAALGHAEVITAAAGRG
jgi:hypothetical protein